MDDVWELETLEEQRAINDLQGIIDCAFAGQAWAREYLVELWGEKWGDIKAKLEVEGSVWYVWWMDGVRNHLAQSRKRVGNSTDLTD